VTVYLCLSISICPFILLGSHRVTWRTMIYILVWCRSWLCVVLIGIIDVNFRLSVFYFLYILSGHLHLSHFWIIRGLFWVEGHLLHEKFLNYGDGPPWIQWYPRYPYNIPSSLFFRWSSVGLSESD